MSKFEGKKTFLIRDGSSKTRDYSGKIRKAGGELINGQWTVELYASDSLWRYSDRLTFIPVEKTSKDSSTLWDFINEGGDGYRA